MLADEKARFDDLHYYNGQDIIVTLPTPMTGLATNSFFLFLFRENSLICLEGKSMTPLWGKQYSLSFLPATPLSPSRTLEGLF